MRGFSLTCLDKNRFLSLMLFSVFTTWRWFFAGIIFGLLSSLSLWAERPNVILIFTDDHGYADLGAQGVDPEVRTPHLDHLPHRHGFEEMFAGYMDHYWATPGLVDAVVAPDRYFYDQHVDRSLPPLPFGEGRSGIYHPWDASRPTTPCATGSPR